MDNSRNLCNPSYLIMQSWTASFRLDDLRAICSHGAPIKDSTVPINLTKAIAPEIGCHMANRCHSTPKVIALESLGSWGGIKSKHRANG